MRGRSGKGHRCGPQAQQAANARCRPRRRQLRSQAAPPAPAKSVGLPGRGEAAGEVEVHRTSVPGSCDLLVDPVFGRQRHVPCALAATGSRPPAARGRLRLAGLARPPSHPLPTWSKAPRRQRGHLDTNRPAARVGSVGHHSWSRARRAVVTVALDSSALATPGSTVGDRAPAVSARPGAPPRHSGTSRVRRSSGRSSPAVPERSRRSTVERASELLRETPPARASVPATGRRRRPQEAIRTDSGSFGVVRSTMPPASSLREA